MVSLSFTYPLVLLAIVPAVLGIVFFFRMRLHKLEENADKKRRRGKMRLFLMITRSVILTLVLIALAHPFVDRVVTEKGDPRIKILVDNSTSMQLYEKEFVPTLQNTLEKYIPTEISTIVEGEQTALADGILAHAQENENVLLVTDGQNNAGVEFGDVALYANQRNVTLNALRLKEKSYDNAVVVDGLEKTIANVENDYRVRIHRTKPGPVRVVVELDNAIVKDITTTDEGFTFTRAFDTGYHTIAARVITYDYFAQNNAYYKVVKIVPKPRVALVTQKPSPYEQLFPPLYELSVVSEVPADLALYSAVMLNDLPASVLDPKVDVLVNYLADGNGVAVIGGFQSYDAGAYKSAKVEQLLPVTIAQAGKKRGETSIVLLLDISGSTGQTFGDAKKVDVEKALAIEVLRDLSPTTRLGVIAFNTNTYTIANMSYLIEKNQPALEDTIASLIDSGGTFIDAGLLRAYEMLQNAKGSKNIILISDGLSQSPTETLVAAKYLASQGVKIYTVGVGEDTNVEAMQQIADLSGGTFFQPSVVEKIKLIFGETPEQLSGRKVFPLSVFDQNHFITQDVKLGANLYGFNVVTPKTSGKLLVTTDTGDPILVAGRFGLGRVAALATDDGTLYAPEMLNKQNSRILTRMVNWVIGDPERKNDRFIDVKDGRVGIPTEVLVKSPAEPSAGDVTFAKIDVNMYRADIVPETQGFYTILGAKYAVNAKREYETTGLNPELEKIVRATGGKLFEPEDVQGMVEHAKERSRRQVVQHASLAWMVALAALLVYLGEVCVRRIVRTFYT